MLFLFPLSALAQGLILSVSPTLFEMTATPEQEWSSNVRVINPNPFDISIYADVVNFAPQGEAGLGKFIPILNDELTEGHTLAEWLDIEQGEIIIPAEQTREIPFSILVPADAQPGGHFAALLIGTKPPKKVEGKSNVRTSQIVTTLVFLRVTGDVVESGKIRSFRTTEWILNKPEVTFELRFQNDGNVHILPQGEIKILNMWGQERGVVPVNRETMFGNVLPDSVRKYDFTWTGQWSFSDVGRYKAVATLAYGDSQRQFTSSETAFWVIPWKIMTVALLVIIGFIAFFTWAIKVYIRKMLSMAGVAPGQTSGRPIQSALVPGRKLSVVAPIEAGMLDLSQRMLDTDSASDRVKTLLGFVGNYKLFFVVLFGFIVFIVLLVVYIQSASVSERAFEITIDGMSDEVKISSEELAYNKLESESPQIDKVTPNLQLPEITIINRSGVSGLAAALRLDLENQGYIVDSISSDLGVEEFRTVVVYPPELAAKALALTKSIGDALLSSYEGESQTQTDITVYVGKDVQDTVQ
ncbi:MAG: LytR C-terminal domain-containing protein [Candidatus Pacebacteria bacterium]|nr:LytR C-terminal domain-containing protein [Candidatus Paceibacterota bacterium]